MTPDKDCCKETDKDLFIQPVHDLSWSPDVRSEHHTENSVFLFTKTCNYCPVSEWQHGRAASRCSAPTPLHSSHCHLLLIKFLNKDLQHRFTKVCANVFIVSTERRFRWCSSVRRVISLHRLVRCSGVRLGLVVRYLFGASPIELR